MPAIFLPIYVQFGKHKQKFSPWITMDYFNFIALMKGSSDDLLRMDEFEEAPDDEQLIGLKVKRLRLEVRFGIPSSAVAMRNGVVLAESDLVVPGDVIEFVKKRKHSSVLVPPPLPSSETQSGTIVPHTDLPEGSRLEDHDPSKLVLSENDFTARYKGHVCELGTGKKYTLLKYLQNAKPAGRCVSLIELRQKIWGVTSEVGNSAIQKQVSLLRDELSKVKLDGVVIDGSLRGHYRLILK